MPVSVRGQFKTRLHNHKSGLFISMSVSFSRSRPLCSMIASEWNSTFQPRQFHRQTSPRCIFLCWSPLMVIKRPLRSLSSGRPFSRSPTIWYGSGLRVYHHLIWRPSPLLAAHLAACTSQFDQLWRSCKISVNDTSSKHCVFFFARWERREGNAWNADTCFIGNDRFLCLRWKINSSLRCDPYRCMYRKAHFERGSFEFIWAEHLSSSPSKVKPYAIRPSEQLQNSVVKHDFLLPVSMPLTFFHPWNAKFGLKPRQSNHPCRRSAQILIIHLLDRTNF